MKKLNEKTDFEIQQELEDQFNEILDESYPCLEMNGIIFYPSAILKECDPIAYRVWLSDWEASLENES
jgi:hypothetical protein